MIVSKGPCTNEMTGEGLVCPGCRQQEAYTAVVAPFALGDSYDARSERTFKDHFRRSQRHEPKPQNFFEEHGSGLYRYPHVYLQIGLGSQRSAGLRDDRHGQSRPLA